ncbi:formylglycine-generating enzyme family protein, partial [Thermodesulfobacteriota bacterium]
FAVGLRDVFRQDPDWYDPCAYGTPPSRNPSGPVSGEEKVMRGGAWVSTTISIRTFWRDHFPADRCNDVIGFRCAKSADR